MATGNSKISHALKHSEQYSRNPFDDKSKSIHKSKRNTKITEPFVIPTLIIITLLSLLSALVISHATGIMSPWQQIGLTDKKVVSIAVSPAFSTDATLFAATPSSLYTSSNSGQSWSEKNSGLKKKNIESIAVSPAYQTDRQNPLFSHKRAWHI